MTVYEFISQLQEAADRAATESTPGREVIVTFIAPNSGFCGPSVRPKFMGYPEGAYRGEGEPTEARYGLNRRQIERVLGAFHVTLPPEHELA